MESGKNTDGKRAPSRIIVFGGRKFCDKYHLYSTMNFLLPWFDKDFVIIQGEAPGADLLGKAWAEDNGHPVICMPAPWHIYGKAAGSKRNGWMLKFAMPELGVQFEGGSGTADMAKRLQSANIPIYKAFK